MPKAQIPKKNEPDRLTFWHSLQHYTLWLPPPAKCVRVKGCGKISQTVGRTSREGRREKDFKQFSRRFWPRRHRNTFSAAYPSFVAANPRVIALLHSRGGEGDKGASVDIDDSVKMCRCEFECKSSLNSTINQQTMKKCLHNGDEPCLIWVAGDVCAQRETWLISFFVLQCLQQIAMPSSRYTLPIDFIPLLPTTTHRHEPHFLWFNRFPVLFGGKMKRNIKKVWYTSIYIFRLFVLLMVGTWRQSLRKFARKSV